MNDTQNKKIAQVTDKTLVVGVDVGSDKHFARAILARGYEVSKKPFEFANTRDGFEKFVNWSYHLATENQLTKIFVALEPTGHYWFNLADYLKAYDVKLVLVAPQHVKHSKEMDDNTQMKNDRKDPLVIAKLVTEGRYMFPYIPEDIYAELREIHVPLHSRGYLRGTEGSIQPPLRSGRGTDPKHKSDDPLVRYPFPGIQRSVRESECHLRADDSDESATSFRPP